MNLIHKLSWLENLHPAVVDSALGSFEVSGDDIFINVDPEDTREFEQICRHILRGRETFALSGADKNRAESLYMRKLLFRAQEFFLSYGGSCALEYDQIRVINMDLDKFYSNYPTKDDIKKVIEYLADPSANIGRS